MTDPITVSAVFATTKDVAWDVLTNPVHIVRWNFASPDWHCPHAENDLREGGRFSSRMEARDGSFGFEFGGTYTEVSSGESYAYTMDDGRSADVTLSGDDGAVTVTIRFEAEHENSRELQAGGWGSILNNARDYAQTLGAI
jgi:uncharacterized protein YndB with AHSA1/START domain